MAKASKKKRKDTSEDHQEISKKKKKETDISFDYNSMFNDTIDEISRRQGVDSDLMDNLTPMSTGMLMLDMIEGGGIRPAMYTHAGWEQTAKTTGALVIMANAIKQKIPLISLWDYEGCFTSDTYLSYGKGKQAKLKDLFDLSDVASWRPKSYPGQQRTDIDTVEPGHRYGGTGLRTANLFYRGKKRTTKVAFNTGHTLVGYRHKMYVLQNGRAVIRYLEDLQVGEQVLIAKKFLTAIPEEWRPVKGFGTIIASRYEVSTLGRVRSVDFKHVVTRTNKHGTTFDNLRTVKGRILTGNKVKDGHLWVALCDGNTQRKRLIHRIVARTFLGKAPEGKPLVLHWNDDPADNRVTNLRYGSELDNNRDKVLRGRVARGERATNANLTDEQAIEILNLQKEGYSRTEIQDILAPLNKDRDLDIYKMRGIIRAICQGKHWSHLQEESVDFKITKEILKDYELAAVTNVERTGKKQHVFDVSLIGVANDVLPHSIVTNGIVTHNSTANSKPYVANILRTAGVKVKVNELFGKKAPKTGKWLVRPIVRYHAETVAEKFFDWLAEIERTLPDKKYVANKWWLVFEDTKVNKAKVGEYADSTMPKKYGKGIWVEAPDGNLQGLVLVDSWPAMNPTSNDDEEADRSLGVHARLFSKHLPRVKGRLAKKMIALLGVNQLSDIPMAMYGPKEQEKGGKALRFNSDVRLWWTSRTSGMPFHPKFDADDRLEHEPSVTGKGKDRYRYVQVQAKKNKLTSPGRKHWIRLWVQDGNGDACGFDPFFDTVHYLKETGQIDGKRSGKKPSLMLDLDGLGKAKKPIDWPTLKEWVLGDKERMKEISIKLGYKPMNLRAFCFKQIREGIAERLYIEARNAQPSKSEDDDE